MTCHALNCPHDALLGQPQCYDHWMMLPERVRESRPWVRPVHNAIFPAEMPLNASRVERGQMEMFA